VRTYGPAAGRAEVVDDSHPQGLKAVRYSRIGAGGNGGNVHLNQRIDRAVTGSSLTFAIHTKVVHQSLPGGGNSPDGQELPLQVEVSYRDASGADRKWLRGFYYLEGGNMSNGTKISQGQWYLNYSFDLMSLSPKPVYIYEINVGGWGWDFDSRAANVSLQGYVP
jgi:hypothetical protein